MNKKFTVAILGVGARGFTYGELMHKSENFEIVALCDYNEAQIEKANAVFHVDNKNIFYDTKSFFEEKRADVLVIATYDKCHVPQCIEAMRLGYDILMEKPVSDSAEEIAELLKVQKETGKKVVVCHVLRYSAPFIKLSELFKSGEIGTLMAIDAIERVRYWHQAQAYVRIQSEVNDLAHPIILAKCCHDLDYIQHYAGARCETVSSIGGLRFFRKENAPEGAAERCLDCKYVDSCVYSAKKIYIDRWKVEKPSFVWPYNKVSLKNPTTEEDLYEGLKTSVFGKCVFKCGVEANEHVVDHQMVQMHFENGVDAQLRMLFTADGEGRRINLLGTHGELVLDGRTGTIEVRRYGKAMEILHTKDLLEGLKFGYGHAGGDEGLINDLYSILIGQKTEYTSLTESLESHLIGVKAEESRLNGGITLKVHGS